MRQVVGSELGDTKKLDISKSTVERDIELGIVYRTDERHVGMVVEQMRLEMNSEGVDVLR